MKAITIKQPYASLIVHGIKDIENRSYPCPKEYIGKRVLIHAGASCLSWYKVLHYVTGAMTRMLVKHKIDGKWVRRQPISAIIGSVEIVDCIRYHPSIWAEEGMYNWVLANPIIYDNPIENIKGKLSFWDYPGIEEVKIECPECGSIEIAVEDHRTEPFSTYLHCCNKCEYVITESEWNRVNE